MPSLTLPALGTTLAAAASTVLTSTIASGAPKAPKPAVMPDPGNPALVAARRQAAAMAAGRSGRASTILSNPAGGDYSSPVMGV